MLKRTSFTLVIIIALALVLSPAVFAFDYAGAEALIESEEVPKIQDAIKRLETQLQKNPKDGEALWLIAKAYLYLGDRIEENKLETFETGKEYADAAVEFLPASPHPHFWQASLMGRIGQTRGILSSLFMVKPMKEALDKALELDASYADAHWVLSQLYHQAPGFPLSIGNKKLALEHAEKSIELDPGNLEYQLQLAVALEYNGRKNEAVQVLDDLLANPALREHPELKAEAEGYRAKWSK